MITIEISWKLFWCIIVSVVLICATIDSRGKK